MRGRLLGVVAWGLALAGARTAWGQAGRYVPPRAPGGGGRSGFPHILPTGGDGEVLLIVGAVVVAIVVLVVGWNVGLALGRRFRTSAAPEAAAPTPSCGVNAATAAPTAADRILPLGQVMDKALQTERLLDALAARDSDLAPHLCIARAEETFRLVQRCWSERNYAPLQSVLTPDLFASHEKLLNLMRSYGEINRIDDLTIDRVEFVHLDCPSAPADLDLTALITFTARVFFVNDRSGAHVRDSRELRQFQEFWTFRRTEASWRVRNVEPSHESDRLGRPNNVAGLAEGQEMELQQGAAK